VLKGKFPMVKVTSTEKATSVVNLGRPEWLISQHYLILYFLLYL
jgi:hypothetical protein